jgi:hypothetical protein
MLKSADAPVDHRGVEGDLKGAPWWGRSSARLPILLVFLAALSWYALAKKPWSAGARLASAPACTNPPLPSARTLRFSRLDEAVRGSRLAWLRRSGALDEEGGQSPRAAFADNEPETSPFDVMVPGGYEIRWWSWAGDHRVADMFVFSGPADAQRYVELAATTRCRTDALAQLASRPPGAREIVWRNPVGAMQADLFFSRGNHAYRISDVPPQEDSGKLSPAERRRILAIVETSSCGLIDAGCRSPSG